MTDRDMMDAEASVRIDMKDGPGPGSARAETALRRHAARAAGSIAFTDSPDRTERGLGPPRSVTFAQADAIADEVAGKFRACGLNKGDALALQLPNTIEAPLLILGAWRAGLIACLMPLLWRHDEIDRAFTQVKPKAVVTVSKYGEERPALTVCEVSAQHMSIRFVFGVGENLPDGVTPIEDWLVQRVANQHEPHSDTPSQPAKPDQTAIMSWTVLREGSAPVPRSHGELAALAQMFASQIKLNGGDTLLNPYPYTSIAAVAGQLVAPLLAGVQTVLHLPFGFGVFVEQLTKHEITYTALPAPVIAALQERRILNSRELHLSRIGCVWPSLHGVESGPDLFETQLRVFDILNIAELALLVRERSSGTDPSLLPLGKIFAAGEQDAGEPILETRVRGSVTREDSQQVLRGTLCVRGSIVPAGPFSLTGSEDESVLHPDPHGFLDAGIGCVVDETIPGKFRCQKSGDMIYHGGAVIAARELDELYAEFPEFLDAAAFVLADAVLGERIFAAVVPRPELSPSLSRLKQFLIEKRVAPYKTPDQLVIVKSIPRNGKGAVQREQIRGAYLGSELRRAYVPSDKPLPHAL
ncbi:MAG: AMP-binding protein [Methyloligellaceae bacterium]